jgi:hypothetical protein
MFIFLVVLSISINIALSIAVYNLFKKNEAMESAIDDFYKGLVVTVQLMRHFDDKQIFEGDDEVGYVFKQLLECINQLDAFVMESTDGKTEAEQSILLT